MQQRGFQPPRSSSSLVIRHDLCRINAALSSTESIKPRSQHGPGVPAVMSRERALTRSQVRNHPCDLAFPNFGRGSGVSSWA